ncbi:MAG TPA: type II toxin-antitoxin system VapC family toxin [Stellaceae bacterium]
MIVLDTNVISEAWRPRPAPHVREWMKAQPMPSLFTTAITEAELLYGIALLPESRRRAALSALVEAMLAEDLAGRVLPFDSAAAREYADIAARRRRAGQPISEGDARIAAIVRSRGATLATRNTADFTACGIPVISPWEA